MNTPVLSISGLHKSFGNVTAVDGLDLTVNSGEIVAFLGPNGAGKSTTIDMILGLNTPDAGSLTVCGQRPRQAVKQGLVAAMLQTGGLLPTIKVREAVELMASLYKNGLSAEEALERTGIDYGDRLVGACSGGQQQRLRFAMSLVPCPELLILDEPTTGMDVTARRALWDSLRAEHRTVLFATHYLEEADDFADRIVIINGGKVVADGPPHQLRSLLSGKTLRARTAASESELAQILPEFTLRAGTLTVTTQNTDAVARVLLERDLANDITITDRSLDDAFVALASSTT